LKRRTAARASPWLNRKAVLPTAVSIKSGGAVRTNNPEVFKAIVVSDPVDVIENQADPATVPDLVLTTELALSLLQTGVVQALLEH
jgi:hypothetical protein